jgi:nitrate reductase (NAD(P)H)
VNYGNDSTPSTQGINHLIQRLFSMSVEKLAKAVFPPSPPLTDKGDSDTSSLSDEEYGGSILLPPDSVNPTEILAVDAASPDKHVPRDPRLIRLTGNHPFNCEAPLTDLFNAGENSR